MKFFKSFILISILAGMGLAVSCVAPPTKTVTEKIDRDYDKRKKDDEDRDKIIKEAKKKYQGKVCEGDKDCEEICDDIYNRRADRSDCEELPIKQVERLETVYEVFEDPDEDDLEDLNLDDLKVLMNISIQPIDNLVGKMNPAEVKDVLIWLAKTEDAAEVFESEDREFKILKALLEELDGNDASSFRPIVALNKSLESGDRFLEIATDEDNEVAVEWIHDLFEELCGSNSEYTKCIFNDHYCTLNMNTDTEESYFGYSFFEKLLDTVLEEHRPSSSIPAWWTTSTESDDLDRWKTTPHDVCSEADF